MIYRIYMIFIWLFFSYVLCFPSIYQEVGNAYLKSYPLIFSQENAARVLAFETLSHASCFEDTSLLLPRNTWKDLELFCGQGEMSSNHLFSRLNYTKTKLGEAALATMLVTPNLERGKILKKIVENNSLYEALTIQLEDARFYEPAVLSFYKNNNEIDKALYDSLYFKNSFLKKLNSNSYALEFLTRSGQLKTLNSILLPLWLYGIARLSWTYLNNENALKHAQHLQQNWEHYTPQKKVFFRQAKNFVPQNMQEECKKIISDILHARPLKEAFYFFRDTYKSKTVDTLISTIPGSSGLSSEQKEMQRYLAYTKMVLKDLYIGIFLYHYFSTVKNNMQTEKHCCDLLLTMQKQLIHVAEYITTMKKANELIKSDSELYFYLSPLSKKLDILENSKNASAKFKKLLSLLSSKTFKGKASLLSHAGRILAVYNLLHEVKRELINCFEAFAQIDAYISIAHLYKKFEKKQVRYCFVNFVAGTKPYLVLKNFWNPFIACEKVVMNSIEMGGRARQNIIITGPNTGGKSTVLTALSLSLLLAHSFGIAPAQEAIMTPFAQIHTYRNISDDKTTGQSLFKAELTRVQHIYDSISRQSPHSFTFTIMDELFNGTNAIEGEAAAYSIAKALGQFPNSMLAIATHFPKLTELEKSSSFSNYKVSIINKNGRFEYPFLLEKGVSHQNIAVDLLQQQGFSSSIIKDARELVKKG